MAFQNARTLMAQKAGDSGGNQSCLLPGGWKAGSMRDHQTPDRTMTASIRDFSYIFTEYQDPDQPGCNIDNHHATDSLVPNGEETRRSRSPCKSEHRSPSKLSMYSDRYLDTFLSVKPGIEDVIERELKKKQLIMVRRLFHDHERRQVRERKSILEHNNNVVHMKSQKEKERKRTEAKMNKVVKEEKTSQGGQVESCEADSRNGTDCQVKKKLIKMKENERYINALKKSIVEKYASISQPVPALCSCANTLIDSDPKTCANNCIFYRNPKAYIQALKNLVGIVRGNRP